MGAPSGSAIRPPSDPPSAAAANRVSAVNKNRNRKNWGRLIGLLPASLAPCGKDAPDGQCPDLRCGAPLSSRRQPLTVAGPCGNHTHTLGGAGGREKYGVPAESERRGRPGQRPPPLFCQHKSTLGARGA